MRPITDRGAVWAQFGVCALMIAFAGVKLSRYLSAWSGHRQHFPAPASFCHRIILVRPCIGLLLFYSFNFYVLYRYGE